jgi:hypothetical protein
MTSSRHSQAGLSMVELIVGMAVTSILLVGITGVLFSASAAYRNWIDRIETSGTGDVLAASLAADSHRYVICSQSSAQLDFCLPGSSSTAAGVSYRNSAGAPYTVLRKDLSSGNSRVVARGLASALVFHVHCSKAANVDAGYIKVLNLPGRAELRVYFQTARDDCWSDA